jgi:putative oxidoreductase
MHGGIEYPLLWLLASLAVALTGAGALSFDALRGARLGSAHGH